MKIIMLQSAREMSGVMLMRNTKKNAQRNDGVNVIVGRRQNNIRMSTAKNESSAKNNSN